MTTKAPPDYGNDLSCGQVLTTLPYPDGTTRTSLSFDFAPNLAEVTGRALLSQAIVRRLVTYRGTLIDDPNYGTDVRQWLNDDLGPGDVARIASIVQAEIKKDARIKSAQVTGAFANNALTLTCILTDAAGPFRLTLAVTAVSVKILQAGT